MGASEAAAEAGRAPPGAPAATLVSLFEGPCVIERGVAIAVPESGQRLLALVGLRGYRLARRTAARTLWPDSDETRASRNLRAALWRLHRAGITAVVADKAAVQLRERVDVDVTLACERAGRLIDDIATETDLRGGWPSPDQFELLPDWDESWVVFERERVRQRLLHGLEAMSRRLLELGRTAEAVEPAMLAVCADPLRESAQCALIEAFVSEGNVAEAQRSYKTYKSLVHRELGVEPGARLVVAAQNANLAL
jgi:DNA-binding SARP family transcriptional activator